MRMMMAAALTAVVSPAFAVSLNDVNPAWPDRILYGRSVGLENAVLSPAGYPIVGAVRHWAVCTNPFQVQKANDLMRAGQAHLVEQVASCTLILSGTRAEWTRERAISEVMEWRLQEPGKAPVTVYAPSPAAAGTVWFGLAKRH
jgi:hypothetical protein